MEKIKLDWTGLSLDPKWYDFFSGEVVPKPGTDAEGAFLKIRPYPSDLAKVIIREDGMVVAGDQQRKIYNYSFLEFRGNRIVDAEDKPLVFSDEVKGKIWDFQLAGIPQFVILKSRQYENEKKAQEKN